MTEALLSRAVLLHFGCLYPLGTALRLPKGASRMAGHQRPACALPPKRLSKRRII